LSLKTFEVWQTSKVPIIIPFKSMWAISSLEIAHSLERRKER